MTGAQDWRAGHHPAVLGPHHFSFHLEGDPATWFIALGTFLLFGATAVLAGAGIKALGELDEARTDRHVQFLTNFAARWNSDLLVTALIAEQRYTGEELVDLIRLAWSDRSSWPPQERRRRRAVDDLVLLLRIPDYFEDLAIMAKTADLDDEGLAPFKGMVVDEWEVWRSAVTELRAEGDPLSYTQFE